MCSVFNKHNYKAADYDRMAKEIAYSRDSPLFDNWKDWAEVVHNYHCPRTFSMQNAINKGHWKNYDLDNFTKKENDFILEVHQLCTVIRRQFKSRQDYYDKFDCTFCVWNYCCRCDVDTNCDKCTNQESHRKAYLLAMMWSYIDEAFCNRRMKKYFKRLERVILALPMERLRNLTPEIIFEPKFYNELGRHLLIQLYRRHYLDQIDPHKIAEKCEEIKGKIAQQQGGAIQSHSAILDDELFEMMRQLVDKSDPSDLLRQFYRNKQQGFFSLNHEHSVSDVSLRKIKILLDESRESFTSSMANSLVIAGKNLMAVFAVATTVVVLAKSAMGFAFKVLLNILHLLYGLIFGSESVPLLDRVKQQSGNLGLSVPFLPSMFMKFVIGAPENIMKNIWKNPNIDMIMRRISYFGDPKIDRGIDRIVEWVLKVLNQTRSWYYREVLGISVPDDISTNNHAIQVWNEEVDSVLKLYYSNEFIWSETSWSMIYNLYARGLTFTRSRLYDRWKNDVFRLVNKLGNILEKFKQHQRDGQTIRNPPVTIYLSGGTGVGKSSVTYPLAAEILKNIFAKEGNVADLHKIWKSLIYMRSAEQEFWDGYENQFVTVFDDFNQQADSASNPNLELFEIIRASNCFPYPLHMASLDQKATTTFTSKIIIVSSNLKKPRTQSLNFPDALMRRFDICVDVSRRPEFEGRLDKFNPLIYNFNLYEMTTGKFIKSVSYSELVQLCADEYFSRCSFVDSIDSYIDGVLKPVVQQGPSSSIDEREADDWAWDESDLVPPPIIQGLMDETAPTIDRLMRSRINREIREETRESKLLSDRLILRPYFSSNDPYDNRSILRRAYDWIRGHTPDYWGEIKKEVESLRRKYEQMMEALVRFKEAHPYLYKTFMVVSFIAGALVFLKMFMSVSSIISSKLSKTTDKPQLWRNALRTRQDVVGESYTLPTLTTVKAEAYTPAIIRGAKAEAYTPAQIKGAKAECIEYDPVTGMPVSQGIKDLNATEVLNSIINRNLYKMYESTQNAAIGHCIFLKGKVALMPRHFVYAFKQSLRNDPDARIVFKSALLRQSFEIFVSELLEKVEMIDSPSEEFEPPVTRDLMAVLVSSSIIHPDITSIVADRDNVSRVRATEVVLPVVVANNYKDSEIPILVYRFRKGNSVLARVVELPVGSEEKEVLRYVRDAWRYEMDTQATECGAPVIARNSKISPGKILGLHIAGVDGTGEGYATPLYRDDVVRILNKFPEAAIMGQKIRLTLQEFPKEQGQVPKEAEFLRHGALDNPVFQPTKTQIVPSLCHGKIKEPVTKPCQLRPTTTFDPRKYRLSRLGNITQAIQSDIVNNAADAFLDECSTVIGQSSWNAEVIKPVYTFEEAVIGIHGEIYVNAIKRNTSPGFPFITKKSTSTRKAFFGESDEYDLSSPQCQLLRNRVNEIIAEAKLGNVLDHYFVDTLKDERKPIHKAHKTRLFSAGPLDYLVACKMYFNGVVALLQKNRNWSHVSVGTNPYSNDWEEIVKSLHRKSKKMVAGDFEGFDASQYQKLLEAAGEVLVQLSARHLGAGSEEVRIMRVLLVSLINSFHICGKEVYQWTHSLPSGHYLTAIINSIFVNIVFGCIWQIAFDEISYIFARSFWNECGIVAYGDDHIVSIPANRIEIFNQLTIPDLFQKIGLSYTMEDKEAVATRPYRSIYEVSYLKRSFYRDEEKARWLAPLALETVLETPMWMHRCPDPELQTIENLEWACKELALHKEDIWRQWFPVLERELLELGHRTLFCRQMEVRDIVLRGECDLAF